MTLNLSQHKYKIDQIKINTIFWPVAIYSCLQWFIWNTAINNQRFIQIIFLDFFLNNYWMLSGSVTLHTILLSQYLGVNNAPPPPPANIYIALCKVWSSANLATFGNRNSISSTKYATNTETDSPFVFRTKKKTEKKLYVKLYDTLIKPNGMPEIHNQILFK